MTETSGFYDGGGVSYDRATLAAFFARFIRNGYHPGYLNELEVYEHTAPDMSVNVKTGGAFIDGYWYKNDAVKNLAIDAAHPTLNRIDRVIVRSTPTGSPGSLALVALKGTAATPAAAPSLSAGEISLAQIQVDTGTTAITTAMITDERDNDTVCGSARPNSVGKTAYADVDMNGLKLTGMGDPSAATDSARYGDISTALAALKLDDLAVPDDNTDLDASMAKHGLCPKGAIWVTASASDTLRASVAAERSTASLTPVFLTSAIYLPHNHNKGGVYRVKCDIKGVPGISSTYAYLYCDGVLMGIIGTSASATYVTVSADITVLGGHILQLYGNAQAGQTGWFKNFTVYCAETPTNPSW